MVIAHIEHGRTAGCIATDTGVVRKYVDLGARYIATHAIRHLVDQSKWFVQEALA